jgi:DNA-binding transcriptional ArsR family regulator
MNPLPFGVAFAMQEPITFTWGGSVNKIQQRDVFDAIADPTRRRLIQLLAESEDRPLHELTAQFPMGRTGVSKHLSILKEAGLVQDRKVGRETRYRLNAAPLKEVQDWVAYYSKYWSANMMRLGQLLEEDDEP